MQKFNFRQHYCDRGRSKNSTFVSTTAIEVVQKIQLLSALLYFEIIQKFRNSMLTVVLVVGVVVDVVGVVVDVVGV